MVTLQEFATACTVRVRVVPAFETAVVDVQKSVAVERVSHVGNACVQSYGGGDQLEGRTRLIDIAHAEASPHPVPVSNFFLVSKGGKTLFVSGLRSSRVVRVELIGLSHGQYGAVVGVHYQHGYPVRVYPLHMSYDVCLNDILYVLVYGGD